MEQEGRFPMEREVRFPMEREVRFPMEREDSGGNTRRESKVYTIRSGPNNEWPKWGAIKWGQITKKRKREQKCSLPAWWLGQTSLPGLAPARRGVSAWSPG